MTYFPHPPRKRLAANLAAFGVTPQSEISRDILWNQPVFKAPVLPNPGVAVGPLPFMAARLTRRTLQG